MKCPPSSHARYDWSLTYTRQVLFDTLSSLKTIHAKGANDFKGDEFYGLLDSGPGGGKSVQMIRDHEAHAARRKLLDRALPPRDQLFQDISKIAREFVSVVDEESKHSQSADGVVDMATLATWYSFDVISTLTFDKSLDMLHSPTWRWVPYCLQEASTFFYYAGYSRFLKFWHWILRTDWPSRLGLSTIVAAQQYANLAAQRVQERRERLDMEKEDGGGTLKVNVDRKDIFGHIIRHGAHTGPDLDSESSLLIAAGSDAVRLAIVATLFYLLQNPRVLQKVVAETRRSLDGTSSPREITETDLGSLKYLRACVDEAMRLTPPKPASAPRETDQSGLVVDGILVPWGTNVGVSIYALHRDPEIFKDPLAYRPERWLERPLDPRMLSAFFPFLKGPRACPGRTVAYFAIQLALYHLLRAYDIEDGAGRLAGGSPRQTRERRGAPTGQANQEDYAVKDWIVGYGEGPFVKLSHRTSIS